MKKKNANLGKGFEKYIEQANERYRSLGLAELTKVETPTTVIRKGKNIVSAFHSDKAIIDFLGVIKGGQGIAIEAKETQIETSFPIANYKTHQLEYMERFESLGGITFTLIHFAKRHETYLITWQQLKVWLDGMAQGGRKSIPYDYFKTDCRLVTAGSNVTVDWIKHI